MQTLIGLVGDRGLSLGILDALLAKGSLDTQTLEPALERAASRVRLDKRFVDRRGRLDTSNGKDWRMLALAVEELARTEIEPDALSVIEVLSFDGGSEIYRWLESRFADRLGLEAGALDTGGESDLYVVRSLEGLARLPRMKTLSLDAYGFVEERRSLRSLTDHPALEHIALIGAFDDDEALLTCSKLRFVSCPQPFALSVSTTTTLRERGVVVATSGWQWDGDGMKAVERAPAAPTAPVTEPRPRVIVVYRVRDVAPALSAHIPADSAVRECLFFLCAPESHLNAALFAALPEPPIAHVDEGVVLAKTMMDLLAIVPEFLSTVLQSASCSYGFHSGSAEEVEAFLVAEGATFSPIAPLLAQVCVLEVRTAVGLAVQEVKLQRMLRAGESPWSLPALGGGRFACLRAWVAESGIMMITPSGTTPLPALTDYTIVRESM